MRKFLSLAVLLIVTLACAIPGAQTPDAMFPTFDPNSLNTAIAQTALVAQTQTALSLPTATITPRPTHTPSITPTFTPTFVFFLSTSTPIPTYTLPPTVGAVDTSPGSGGVIDSNDDGVPDKKDPRTMTGKEWSCSVLGTTLPRKAIIQPGARFNVKWILFNSGTKEWPYYGVDLVYSSGYRHEGRKIQDFNRSVPSGGEIQVGATFIAPKAPGEYETFFNLMVGRREFCRMTYIFVVPEDE